MAERKIVVPEGMLKALKKSLDSQFAFVVDGHEGDREYALEPALESALRWLSDNPISPTMEQQCELYAAWTRSLTCNEQSLHKIEDQIFFSVVEWQRRMFFAPEPEVPEEIKDLLCRYWDVEIMEAFVEAYRRGQQAGKKKTAMELWEEEQEAKKKAKGFIDKLTDALDTAAANATARLEKKAGKQ